MNDVWCKKYDSGVDTKVLKNNSGLATSFILKCCICPYRVKISSDYHERTQIATVNIRYVYIMRSIGRGAEARRIFWALMNLPQPSTRFVPCNKRLINAVKLVSEETMQNAAQEADWENGSNKNIAVAVDGTRQKRSYSSLNDVVTVISIDTGKVIDVEILSKYCMCSNKGSHKKDFKCNFEGSSGSMEVEGASRIFQRSFIYIT
ncbi:uncharacterized protein NPIL_407061 [Nephila pilipes]|uniref:Mutator-like transposase domain-containing protein n=1 Tax=Nephila pilipes TaxID=299642 RepID=A0A8X6QM08_NEPPI|nr:uncharacterized protein NPIL_407061 [Nephila pilipes]